MMDKVDRDFILKVSKKADKSYLLAEKAFNAISELSSKFEKKNEVVVNKSVDATQTTVIFDSPEDIKKHSQLIIKMNKDIDAVCKKLKIKELLITFKKPPETHE